MPKVDSMFSLFQAHCAALPNQDKFQSTPIQTLVKDEMAFAPTLDPYISLHMAVERLQSGQSVFFETPEQAKKILAGATHA